MKLLLVLLACCCVAHAANVCNSVESCQRSASDPVIKKQMEAIGDRFSCDMENDKCRMEIVCGRDVTKYVNDYHKQWCEMKWSDYRKAESIGYLCVGVAVGVFLLALYVFINCTKSQDHYPSEQYSVSNKACCPEIAPTAHGSDVQHED